MFIVISWILIGIIAGGMLGGALADMSANHRGDIGLLFGGLVVGATLGAICGGVVGKGLQGRFAGDRRKLGMVAVGTWIGAGLLVLGIVMFEMAREKRDEQARLPESLVVRYEMRLPPGMAVNPEHVVLELRTSVGVEPPFPYQQRPPVVQEDGRVVIRSAFQFYKAAASRIVAFQPAYGQQTYLFTLRLPERPKPGGAMTDWQPVDQVDEGGWFKAARPARPDERLEIRYAVARPYG